MRKDAASSNLPPPKTRLFHYYYEITSLVLFFEINFAPIIMIMCTEKCPHENAPLGHSVMLMCHRVSSVIRQLLFVF